MERAEDLTTRLNTLSYDHERLVGMHKAAKDQAAHAQREAESAKSKHAYVPCQPHPLNSHSLALTILCAVFLCFLLLVSSLP